MRIEVKGRNIPVSEDLREHVERRFRVIGKQVSELAELEVEVFEEHNPSIAESQVAEATLHLKGVTLRACSASRDCKHSVNVVSARSSRVQVKRHREKRRKRREARTRWRAGRRRRRCSRPNRLGQSATAPELGAAQRGRPKRYGSASALALVP